MSDWRCETHGIRNCTICIKPIERFRQASATKINSDLDLPDCGICGEQPDDEMGEFWDGEDGPAIVAHADCGLSRGLKVA